VLDSHELKRRLDAARRLRGMKQTDLAELLVAEGFGKHDVGRLERGELALQRKFIDALCRHLRVPERWFTEPDVDIIVGFTQSDQATDVSDDQLRRAAELMAPQLLQAARALRQAEAEAQTATRGQDHPRGAAEGRGA
jgi:transcriptional regulator with XRE-family HTH domain